MVLFYRQGALEKGLGNYVLACIVAFGGTCPEEEFAMKCWRLSIDVSLYDW